MALIEVIEPAFAGRFGFNQRYPRADDRWDSRSGTFWKRVDDFAIKSPLEDAEMLASYARLCAEPKAKRFAHTATA